MSALLLAGFCFIPSLYLTFASSLWFFIVKKSPFPLPVFAKLLLLPLLFSAFHSLLPVVFPWNMGYPWLWGGMPGAQTAELWGFRFLNTLFYMFNLLFLVVFKHFDLRSFIERRGGLLSSPRQKQVFVPWSKIESHLKKNNLWKPQNGMAPPLEGMGLKISIKYDLPKTSILDRIGQRALLSAVLLFVALNGLGFWLKRRLPAPDKELKVILVQNNIGSLSHLNPRPFKSKREKSFHISKNLTYQAVLKYAKQKKQKEDINFILWPESAYPYSIRKGLVREKPLSQMIGLLKIPLITGGVSYSLGHVFNSLFVLDRKGQILNPVYDKTKLLIFGEYFPGMRRFGFLRKMFPYFGSNLTPGKGVQVKELEGILLGWQICYEGLFDQLSRRLAQNGAQVLVNITNDSWYGPWQEPYQHLAMSLARAIETRRPLIRATNTGRSAVIRADGKLIPIDGDEGARFSPMNKPWFQLYKIPYYENPPQSLFMSWGYYINEIFLAVLALLILLWIHPFSYIKKGLKKAKKRDEKILALKDI